jgi:hypothetical protein
MENGGREGVSWFQWHKWHGWHRWHGGWGERPQEDPNPDKSEPNRISRKDARAQRTKTLCDLAAWRETPCSMCKNLSAQARRVSENP